MTGAKPNIKKRRGVTGLTMTGIVVTMMMTIGGKKKNPIVRKRKAAWLTSLKIFLIFEGSMVLLLLELEKGRLLGGPFQ